ncbi:MAG: hypothetical protein J0L86_05465 [Flavobacteriales bacterium]|nr:hypothetical protein [Flavobacteriales bacterium]
MKKIILFTLFFFSVQSCFSQDFNAMIEKVADTIAKKIIATGKTKTAITDFINNDLTITQLGSFLSEEISSELANRTDNQKKFRVLERAKLDQIFKEKNLLKSVDGSSMAKELGKIAAADILIFATITDFEGYYRVVIKLLDTKEGDALSSFKVNFVKTPSLDNLNKQTIKGSNNSLNENKDTSKKQSDNSSEELGDICFSCKSFYEYNLSITIFKVRSDEVEKEINVNKNETTCAYELPVGVHKVELKWLFSGGNGKEVHKTEQKEIRVIKGKTETIEYYKGY